MTTSAGDIINGSLRLLGILAEGETPSADMSADALTAMNQMIESWDTERLAVFTTQEQVVTWPASQRTRTFGPTGQLVGNRPIGERDNSTYYKANGISYPITAINQSMYNNIALKTATSTLPQYIYMNSSFPDVDLYLYPVPTQALEFHIVSVEQLDQPAVLATTLAFPPGYLRAFRYNLACEIAPEFGVEPAPTIARIAMASKRNLKRINNPGDVMSFPNNLIGLPGSRFNIFSGEPF